MMAFTPGYVANRQGRLYAANASRMNALLQQLQMGLAGFHDDIIYSC
jgi:hypothetical protein